MSHEGMQDAQEAGEGLPPWIPRDAGSATFGDGPRAASVANGFRDSSQPGMAGPQEGWS